MLFWGDDVLDGCSSASQRWLPGFVGPWVYGVAMTTIDHPTREEVKQQRDAILETVGLSVQELAQRAVVGELVGEEWSAWAEVEELGYLLGE